MALEEYKEEGKEKEVSNETPAVEGNMELMLELQRQIQELKQQQNSVPQQNQGSSDMQRLIEVLGGNLNAGKDVNVETGQFHFNNAHSEFEIDPDDFLDEDNQVTFISHLNQYVIADDKRMGRNVKAPLSLIVFKYDSAKEVKNGKETDLLSISAYTCQSKKELEWLRSHTYFNIRFFDKIDRALSPSARKASRLAQQMSAMTGMGQHQLMSIAKQHGVPFTADLNGLRAEIAAKIVDDQLAKNREAGKSLLEQQLLEANNIGLTEL